MQTRFRGTAIATSLTVALVGMAGGAGPAAADSTTSCSTGNANQVLKVFEHANFNEDTSGIKDDLCWKDGSSRDDEFSDDESGLDDIGESGNFHDLVSSFKIVNNGTNPLCVWFYKDAFRSGTPAEKRWVAAGAGIQLFTPVAHNDAYDSVDLFRISQGECY
jgi:hypothetical protein